MCECCNLIQCTVIIILPSPKFDVVYVIGMEVVVEIVDAVLVVVVAVVVLFVFVELLVVVLVTR